MKQRKFHTMKNTKPFYRKNKSRTAVKMQERTEKKTIFCLLNNCQMEKQVI